MPHDANKKSVDVKSLLDELVKELKIRNYSFKTLKNYRALCGFYLSWLKQPPSADDVTAIKRYQLFLKQEKKYSPRTINLATAAIQFLYCNVLKNEVSIGPTDNQHSF